MNQNNQRKILPSEEKALLTKNINLALNSPEKISTSEFMDTYNKIYLFCLVSTETFYIEGGAIYDLLVQEINNFSLSIPFISSIDAICLLFQSFTKTETMLSGIYSLINRFYVESNRYTNKDIFRISDLFYRSIYYNHILPREEFFNDIIFADLKLSRKNMSQDINNLKTVFGVYLKMLSITNQDEKMKLLKSRYIKTFIDGVDFSADIGKVLKKIYLENYYITNILGQRTAIKEILSQIENREDEIINFGIQKLYKMEKGKYIFKIIYLMDEAVQNRFIVKYSDYVLDIIKKNDSFILYYRAYERLMRQIEENAIKKCESVFQIIIKNDFVNKRESVQEDIYIGIVNTIDSIILNLYKNMGREFLEIELKYLLSSNTENNVLFPVNHQKDGFDNIFEFKNDIGYDHKMLCRLFSTISTQVSREYYISKCQKRLINGSLINYERFIANFIYSHQDISDNLWLNVILNTYTNYLCINENRFYTSIKKHIKHLWRLNENKEENNKFIDLARKSSSQFIRKIICSFDKMIGLADIGYKEVFVMILNLSPVLIEMNHILVKMAGTTFIIFELIRDNEISKIDINEDLYKREIDLLVKHKLILLIDGMFSINKKLDVKFINMFEAGDDVKIVYNKDDGNKLNTGAIEALICRLMKKYKKIERVELVEEIKKEGFCEMINESIIKLKEREYIEEKENVLYYLP